jgi:SAM-dependent methyltransferase
MVLQGAMSDPRQYAPATERNREPILAVLRQLLPAEAAVLEVASGTGEHAAFFAAAEPGWRWIPSDPDETARASIAAWTQGLANVAAPLALDAAAPDWPVDKASFDALLCINMIHIAPWEATLGLMGGAARALRPGGLLYLYGPFMRDGRHTAPSNEDFDAWLKERDARFGVRDMDEVSDIAASQGLYLQQSFAMPANNFSLAYTRRHGSVAGSD